MIRAFLRILFLLFISFNISMSTNLPENTLTPSADFIAPISDVVATERATKIVAQMSTDEKLAFIKGDRGFFIKGYPQYGIPDVYLSDATQGVNIRNDWEGADLSPYALPKSVSFPNALCLTAAWNPELAYAYAHSIGEECRAGGIGILLGPGMNIYRHSQCGRNFEYLGEDPYLAGTMVEKYIAGVQNTGVIATLKHFVANNTDYNRRASNSIISERALHEIYLPAFKKGVEAGAMAVMTAYNQLNGEWTGQSDTVINKLLREELGFENLVMTDWWSVNDCKAVVTSGQDLEMPGGDSMGSLKDFVESGEVAIESIDRMCVSIIKTLAQMEYLDRPLKDKSYLEKFEAHEAVALQTAREGIVLLRNTNDLLPLEADTQKNILITGSYVTENIYGGGSGEVKGYNIVTIMDALSRVYPNIEYNATPTDDEIKEADFVMTSVGTFDYEGSDRHFAISQEQEDLVKRVADLNRNNLVIVNSGSGIRMTDWQDVAGIIYNWYPGQTGNIALAEILTGKTNPSGKLPMTIEKEFKDSPGYGYTPEGAEFMCDKEGWLDLSTPFEKLNRWSEDISIQNAPGSLYDVDYKEGVMVGYRWYESKKIEPLFPFGSGLSYTEFELSDAALKSKTIAVGDPLSVSLTVKNNGARDGATVVQCYVSEENPTLPRPPKELKAYKKVFLQAGETQTVHLEMDAHAFSFWCPESKAWTTNPGNFKILIGESSDAIDASLKLVLK